MKMGDAMVKVRELFNSTDNTKLVVAVVKSTI